MDDRAANITVWVYAVLAWLQTLLLFIGGLALMFLAPFFIRMLQEQPEFVAPDLPAGALEALAGGLGMLIGILFIGLAAAYFAAGLGLVQRRNWARVLTIVMSAFSLLSFPIGTALGVFGIYAFGFDENMKSQFNRRPSQPAVVSKPARKKSAKKK